MEYITKAIYHERNPLYDERNKLYENYTKLGDLDIYLDEYREMVYTPN